MPKLLLILFTLPLLCCGKDKNQQAVQVQTTQAEEICDSSCAMRKEFENSTAKIDIKISDNSGFCGWREACGGITVKDFYISVAKTATGAFAKYKPWGKNEDSEIPESLDIELNMEEWQDFTGALYKCCTSEWEKGYGKYALKRADDSLLKIHTPWSVAGKLEYRNKWMLKVYSLDSTVNEFVGYEANPPNWGKFLDAIDKLIEKSGTELDTDVRFINVKGRIQKIGEGRSRSEEPPGLSCSFSCDSEKIKKWYLKEFREPITDFELLTRSVTFTCSGEACRTHWFVFDATRTDEGVYLIHSDDLVRGDGSMAFSMEEWLNFMRTLRKSGFDKWGEYSYYGQGNPVELGIYSSDRKLRIDGTNAKPHWDRIIKTIDNYIYKMREVKK